MDTTDLLTQRAHQPNPDGSLRLHLSAMGRDFELHLTPSAVVKPGILQRLNTQSLPDLYQGSVVGDTNSWARISIEDSKPTGYLFSYGQLLRLELLSRVPDALTDSSRHADSSSRWVMYEPRLALASEQARAIDPIRYAPATDNANVSRHQPSIQRILPDNADTHQRLSIARAVTRVMRVGIVIDSRFDELHNGRGLAQALSIMNAVDAIYQSQLGLALVVESMVVYDNPVSDPMREKGGSVEQMLGDFRSIRLADDQLPNDLTLVHLFTGHNDPDRVIGLGWINTACRADGYDVSLSTPFPFDMLLTAHEIAHNLGALHDDDNRCEQLNDADDSHIMWSFLSSRTRDEFSACSLQSMQPSISGSCNLENIDLAIALRASPAGTPRQRIVAVQVSNLDGFRPAHRVSSRTTFPDATRLSNQSAGCQVVNDVLVCEHGTIAAGTTDAISVLATLAGTADQQVTALIELDVVADINHLDNRAALNVLQLDEAVESDAANAAANTAAEIEPPTDAGREIYVSGGAGNGNAGSAGGIAGGRLSGTDLFCLGAAFWLLQRRRTHQETRSTA